MDLNDKEESGAEAEVSGESELSLKYGSKRQVAKGGIHGFFIGLAVIVPGVSGSAKKEETAILTAEDITVNTAEHRVYRQGKEIELKNKEHELLVFFMTNRGLLFSKESLYESIWGMDALGDNSTIAVHISRLREKLEDNPSEPRHIVTVRGAGYRFV